jgi:aryl-alcohol dehydrogenase-like predicted oxidoreductase
MKYRVLGQTGLRVSELGLGGGTIGTGWGWGADKAESQAIFDGFAEAGGNFIDCAAGYQGGEAERFLGEFIGRDRDAFIVSTKYGGGPSMDAAVAKTGANAKSLMQSLDGSLKRFGVDRVDLFYVHFDDGVTPTEEILRGLEDAVRTGKTSYVGFSNFPAWRIARAATISEYSGGPPIAAVQLEYSLVERSAERELLPMAEAMGIGVTVWAALGGGLLTGKYRKGGEGRLTHGGGRILTESTARESAILDALEAVAADLGAPMAQVAIAWVLAKAARVQNAIVPILGARTSGQLSETLGALSLGLADEHLAQLDAASAIPLGYPHEWLASDILQKLGEGAAFGQVVKPARPPA